LREETFNTWWLSIFVILVKDILREWWQDPSKFQVRSDQAYRTEGLWKVYQIITTMMCLLYDNADCEVLYETCVPLMHLVTTRGKNFNLVNILASSLKTNIAAAKHPES